jgi:hypothetical protein
LAPIMYLSSHCIVTWLVHRVCIIIRCFTSRIPNCDAPNILSVAVK